MNQPHPLLPFETLLVLMVLALTPLAQAQQVENKSYETSVFKSWLAEAAQSHITNCSEIRLTSISTGNDGAAIDAFVAKALATVNGERREVTVAFYVYPNDRYRVQYGPIFGESETERENAKTKKQAGLITAAASRLFIVSWREINEKIGPNAKLSVGLGLDPTKIDHTRNYDEAGLFRVLFSPSDEGKPYVDLANVQLQHLKSLSEFFGKFKSWCQTATDNKVTDVEKILGSIKPDYYGLNYRLTFSVNGAGTASLLWTITNNDSYNDFSFSESKAEVEAAERVINSALAQAASLHEDCLKRAMNGEDIKPVVAKENLFK